MNSVPQLAPDEPLSPELVLVLPAELRAQVLAGLALPAWPKPLPRAQSVSPPVADPVAPSQPMGQSVAKLVVARFAQLALIFVAVTILTLAMSLVAQAVR